MRSIALFFAGALAGACAFVVVSSQLQGPGAAHTTPVQDTQPAHRTFAANAANPEAPTRQEVTPANTTALEPSAGPDSLEPSTRSEWNSLVGGMLEWEVQRRTGHILSAEQRDRLLAQLARLREASLELQEAPAEPDDPAALRERLTRTLTLVQVDEAFRRELGVGVADFLRGLDSRAVEDVSSVPDQQP